MIEKERFFILKDEEYDDVLPCIRDREFELEDIYGHHSYDDIEQLCDFLNKLYNENKMLKSKSKGCYANVLDLIDDKMDMADKHYNKNYLEAKILNGNVELVREVSLILDTVFYWKGYINALRDLKSKLNGE